MSDAELVARAAGAVLRVGSPSTYRGLGYRCTWCGGRIEDGPPFAFHETLPFCDQWCYAEEAQEHLAEERAERQADDE